MTNALVPMNDIEKMGTAISESGPVRNGNTRAGRGAHASSPRLKVCTPPLQRVITTFSKAVLH
jgi:hypothetical protein